MTMSMTGYGRARTKLPASEHVPAAEIWVEVRAFNHRFLSLKSRLPEQCQALVPAVEKAVRGEVKRGSVLVAVDVRFDAIKEGDLLDRRMIEAYMAALDEIARARGCPPPGLDAVVRMPGVVRDVGLPDEMADGLRQPLLDTLGKALEELLAMRRSEGEHLKSVIMVEVDLIEGLLEHVRAHREEVIDGYRQRLVDRIRGFIEREGVTIEDATIVREVAFFADRSDVAEEVDRLDSHLTQLRKCLDDDEAAGKQIEFIVQEMFREANTLLAKIGDPGLSEEALLVKSAVERIKEQALNVE